MATEFRRFILKVSDVTTEVATIPVSNDHTDGSWISTDIYEGELFLNVADDLLQTRTETGIINLVSGGSGVTTFLGLTDTPAVYTGAGGYTVKVNATGDGLEFVEGGAVDWGDIGGTLADQTDLQAVLDTFLTAGDNVSDLVNDAGYLTTVSKADVGLGNVDNTSDANKPVSTAQQTEIDTKQDTLVSATNIKTINGSSVLGSGDLTIGGATDFLDLTDTPSGYEGFAGTFVKVNANETALEFVDKVDDTLITTVEVGTSRDLILTDRNKNLENSADITFTFPLNSSVAFPLGTVINFTKKFESLQWAKAVGVTVNSIDESLEAEHINGGTMALKIATDEWNLIGNLLL